VLSGSSFEESESESESTFSALLLPVIVERQRAKLLKASWISTADELPFRTWQKKAGFILFAHVLVVGQILFPTHK